MIRDREASRPRTFGTLGVSRVLYMRVASKVGVGPEAPAGRTATRVANHGIWRHSPALGEYEPPILNRLQRSVNRKVQGSNP